MAKKKKLPQMAGKTKIGTCKWVRGRGGRRQLCKTGQGLTGWEFRGKKPR